MAQGRSFRNQRSTRAVSTVITTIILSAVLLGILVVASFVAVNILDMQIASTEFEQAKTNMLLLNDIIQDVSLRRGSGGYVQFNQRTGGIGIASTTENINVRAVAKQTAVVLKPNGLGTYSEWIVSNTMDPRYGLTSDEDDDTYIMTVDTTRRESQQLEDTVDQSPTAIRSVTFTVTAKPQGSSGNYFRIRLRTHNTDYENSTLFNPKGNLKDYSVTYRQNPNTNAAWTWSELNDLEIGCRATTIAGGRIDVSEFKVIVDYGAPSDQTVTIVNGSFSWYLAYRGSTRMTAAETDLSGVDNDVVDMTQGIGYLRVEQDQGVKIKLDFNRIRIDSETLVDTKTALVQITLINITKGNMGGAGTVNLKVQNQQVTSTAAVLLSPIVTVYVQGVPLAPFDGSTLNPAVIKTVVMFTEIKIQVSTA
jgi:hypothetical protein